MNAVVNLIHVLFDLLLTVVLFRLWLQLAGADFYNPISQFVAKVTTPLTLPFRFLPDIKRFSMSTFALAFVVGLSKIAVLQTISGAGYPILPMLLSSLFSVIDNMFSIVFWVVIARALLSWFNQGYNPVEAVLGQLTEPLLAPVRRIIPPIGGLDLSVLFFIIGWQFLHQLIRGFFLM